MQGYLAWLHISSATCSIFCSTLTVLGRPLPAFWREIEFVLSILCRRSLTELTAQSSLRYKTLYKYVLHHIPFLDKVISSMIYLISQNRMFINKLWRNNDVTLLTLHCVSGSVHILGSSYGTLENIWTKFTHISQKWFYFSVHYISYLSAGWHI